MKICVQCRWGLWIFTRQGAAITSLSGVGRSQWFGSRIRNTLFLIALSWLDRWLVFWKEKGTETHANARHHWKAMVPETPEGEHSLLFSMEQIHMYISRARWIGQQLGHKCKENELKLGRFFFGLCFQRHTKKPPNLCKIQISFYNPSDFVLYTWSECNTTFCEVVVLNNKQAKNSKQFFPESRKEWESSLPGRIIYTLCKKYVHFSQRYQSFIHERRHRAWHTLCCHHNKVQEQGKHWKTGHFYLHTWDTAVVAVWVLLGFRCFTSSSCTWSWWASRQMALVGFLVRDRR